MSLISEYYSELGKTLYTFQWIEELLKQYLIRANFFISLRLEGLLPFKPLSYKDLEGDTLAHLLKKFSRLNTNDVLISEMQQLRPIRNRCAHRGFLVAFEKKHDKALLPGEIDKMKKITIKADRCVRELLKEIKQLEKIMVESKL